MALVTTVGSSTADSYVSITEADSYCESHGITAWDDLDDDDEKAPALRKATQYMDGTYRGRLKGRKTEAEQALTFPRKECSDEDGNEIDDDVIPTCWKQATIEVAAIEAATPGTLFPTIERLTQSEKIGSISVSYFQGADGKPTFTIIDNLVSGLLTTGGNSSFGFLMRA